MKLRSLVGSSLQGLVVLFSLSLGMNARATLYDLPSFSNFKITPQLSTVCGDLLVDVPENAEAAILKNSYAASIYHIDPQGAGESYLLKTYQNPTLLQKDVRSFDFINDVLSYSKNSTDFKAISYHKVPHKDQSLAFAELQGISAARLYEQLNTKQMAEFRSYYRQQLQEFSTQVYAYQRAQNRLEGGSPLRTIEVVHTEIRSLDKELLPRLNILVNAFEPTAAERQVVLSIEASDILIESGSGNLFILGPRY